MSGPAGPASASNSSLCPEKSRDDRGRTLAPNLDAAARARAAEAAEGNPLFLEQLLALAAEDGDELPLPPHHPGAARRPARPSRGRREDAPRCSGRCWQGILARRPPRSVSSWDRSQRSSPAACAQATRRARAVSPPRRRCFPLCHILVRDAAYSAIAKERRAELHERFADWLEQAQTPYDEIVGYHLEQAYRLRAELGRLDEAGGALATRAAKRLATAGRRARVRGDASAAINLFERASELYPSDDVDRYRVRRRFATHCSTLAGWLTRKRSS